MILRAFSQDLTNDSVFRFLATNSPSHSLPGPWQVRFIEGGPLLPSAYSAARLDSWTRNGDPETERFAGTAVYTTTFDAPPGKGPWLLDLGQVCHSARVRLNGREMGTLVVRPYRMVLDPLRAEHNQLEVEVTDLSANRIRDLDRRWRRPSGRTAASRGARHVPARWSS